MAFSPDGKKLAFGNSTSDVFVCDLVARKVRHTLYGHLHHVGAIVFTPDGALISGASDGTVRIWSPGSGRLRTLFRCEAGVQELCLLQGGKQLLVVTSREAQVWSLEVQPAQAKLYARGKDGISGLEALAFDAEGTRLATVGQDAVVRIWSVGRRTITHNLTGHTGRSMVVAFGPAGTDLLVSGGEDRKVLLWRLREPKPPRPVLLAGHTAPVTCLAITPDGTLIVSGSLDGSVYLWDAGTAQVVHRFTTGHGPVRSLAVSGDGQRLVTGGQDGLLRLWNLKERQLLLTTPSRGKGPIDQLAFTHDGRLAATIQGQRIAFHELGRKGEGRLQS